MSVVYGVHCTIFISRELNDLLEESMKYSNRSKIDELELRVSDHIRKYSSISASGETKERGGDGG
ncbi:TraY domain-containing protein [uncultured Shewanella sp.]|uniref:TraY domain-containing protein n=1 Tax=uncultured Shewanella sp. TaxID=173975 RepID=UPI002611044F|nr:TraY domain-containing protein [uncultured Shewanella sp.]